MTSPRDPMLGSCILTACLLALGCGGAETNSTDQSGTGATTPGNGGAAAPPADAQPVSVARESLELGEYLPPLDDGRIELAEPAKWKRFPRSNDFVARFYLENSTSLPRILVTAEPSTLPDTTAENLSELLKQVHSELADSQSVLESPLPMIIGGRPFVRYVTKVAFRMQGAERQMLTTVVGGRRYKIDLQLKTRTINDFKAAGYAVGASLRAAETDTPPAPMPDADLDPGADPKAAPEPQPEEPAKK